MNDHIPRNKLCPLMLTDAEYAWIEHLAAQRGISISDAAQSQAAWGSERRPD